MTKATLDQILYTLQRAADYLRITRWRELPAEDVVAIAILEQAAKDVLGVRSAQ